MPISKIIYSTIALLLLIGAGCNKKSAAPTDQKPLILVSIAPYKSMAEKIAGQGFEVITVVPAASNPHSFEPTSLQVTTMGQSQVWLRIGEPFERKILSILKANHSGLVVADLRDGIDMIEGDGCKHCHLDHFDRHIWLSPKLAKQQAAIIERALIEKFPEQKEIFHKNLLTFSEELDQLDQEIREILQNVTTRTLLTSHAAFAYFCKDYDLVQLSVEHEGKDPLPRHLDEILKKTSTDDVNLVLSIPQHNNKGAQLIAEKQHLPLKQIDPYSENYFETMRQLAKLIADPYAN